ncbi:aminodeoxychorismate synthase component I [Lewinella sp. IMCC34191]|uniref:aminodeoxychorismate synthase component I n=1 Tax=Lewinella sp. IMCC34191 TaxID=2259172 RepID=UPI0013003C3D|nr:aminodeoxychorismate synthase component I [Lewinella sp. IMCC34191]
MNDYPSSSLPPWAAELNRIGQAGQACFFLLDFELQKPLLFQGNAAEQHGIRFNFPERSDGTRSPVILRPEMKVRRVSKTIFKQSFEIIQSGLQRGDSYLANLTFATPVDLGDSTLEDVYNATQAKYRILVPDNFVCFSPETFITVDEYNYLETRPMKGTAVNTPEGISALLNDPKEIAEHATIVDLMRNDISRVARNVRVTNYRYLRPLERQGGGLVQTSTKIGGNLSSNWRDRLGSILYDLLPAGSVSGAPKPATLELIRRAEARDRGYYCGIGGYFDGSRLDTCVLIRYLEKDGDDYWFRSGGGITALSRMEDEYAEMQAKIRFPPAN